MEPKDSTTGLTQEKLKQLLTYDSETGLFVWSLENKLNPRKGKAAGYKSSYGYLQIEIGGRAYMAHRLAWLFVYGAWPTFHLDHINGVTDDNRLCNLREVTRKQNMHNRRGHSKSGYKGVYWDGKNFQVQLTTNGRKTTLGRYKTAEEAYAHYVREGKRTRGEYFRG